MNKVVLLGTLTKDPESRAKEAGYFDGVSDPPEFPAYQFDASDEGIPF